MKLVGAYANSGVPRVRMDHCYITETNDGHTDNEDLGDVYEDEDKQGDRGDEALDPVEVEEKRELKSDRVTSLVMQEPMCTSTWA